MCVSCCTGHPLGGHLGDVEQRLRAAAAGQLNKGAVIHQPHHAGIVHLAHLQKHVIRRFCKSQPTALPQPASSSRQSVAPPARRCIVHLAPAGCAKLLYNKLSSQMSNACKRDRAILRAVHTCNGTGPSLVCRWIRRPYAGHTQAKVTLHQLHHRVAQGLSTHPPGLCAPQRKEKRQSHCVLKVEPNLSLQATTLLGEGGGGSQP